MLLRTTTHHALMLEDLDQCLMSRAVALSRLGFPAPNPHVGCVIVREEEIVGEGFHEFAGGPHAEVVALAQAGEHAFGATAYVTLEPCNHHGRTPPCSEALIRAQVARVVVAVNDPNPRAVGGVARLREAGIEVRLGVNLDEAIESNFVWMTAMRRKRPYVAVKAAITSDGFIARPDGTSKWITGPEARLAGHRLRAEMGAVLIGSRTAEIDDPQLTARFEGVHRQPTRIVLDPRGRLSPELKLFHEDAEVLHVTANGPVSCPSRDGSFDLHSLMNLLWERGVTSLLVEGGGATIASFFEARLVDRLHLFISPTRFGEGISWRGSNEIQLPALELAKASKVGGDVHCVFDVLDEKS